MYGCENWTIKKAEHQRIDAFELWCWRRLLRVPWTARRANQSILKEISPGCSLEGIMLKLKLQSFGHLMRRVDSLEKTLMLGRIRGRRRRGQLRKDEMAGWHHWLDGRESEWTLGVGDGQGGLACGSSWGHKESDMTELLNWTELNGFSSSHVWMWELDHKESWLLKNWCFWTVVLDKTLESPLDCKEIQPVHSEGVQPWDFFGSNDAKAETPVLWPPHAKSWLIGKDSDARRNWGQEEKGTTEDDMAGWHHWLNGCESEWTLGVGDGQGGLACCDSWGRKELHTTERLNCAQ